MRKEYKYSNLKQETNTSGKVILELMKQKKIKTKRREPKQPTWAVAMEQRINDRLDVIEARLSNVVKLNNLKE